MSSRGVLGRLIVTLTLVLVAACARRAEDPVAAAKERVEVLAASSRLVAPEYRSFGTIVFLAKADVFPSMEGIIESLEAEEGQTVKAGMVLARLDARRLVIRQEEAEAEIRSRTARLALAEEKLREGAKTVEARLIAVRSAEAELEQSRSELANARTAYENKQKLFEVQGVSREELEAVRVQYVSAQTRLARAEGELEIQRIGFRDQDITAAGYEIPLEAGERMRILAEINTRMLAAERAVAEAELNAARANLRSVELALDEAVIRAPISGIVGARYLDLGEKASPDRQLFTIFKAEQVYAQIEVSERNLGELAVGQEAFVTVESEKEVELKGAVELISPVMNPDTRTARVRILIANRQGRLTPGLFVRVRVLTGRPAHRLLLPEDAVLRDEEGGAFVYVVRGGRVFRQRIEIGPSYDKELLVLSGIEEGERVVRHPSFGFKDGTEVEAVP